VSKSEPYWGDGMSAREYDKIKHEKTTCSRNFRDSLLIGMWLKQLKNNTAHAGVVQW